MTTDKLADAIAARDAAIQQAKIWKMEAQTANATIAEIYRLVGSKAGNWNGAKPVREALAERVAKPPANGEAELPPLPELSIGTFRKKPVAIKAVQLTRENGQAVAAWCGGQWLSLYGRGDRGEDISHVSITTLEGTMRADLGDWIIRGVKGEFYPCKPDIFTDTYDAAIAALRQPVTTDGRMPDSVRDWLTGMSVSVDVSTDEDSAHDRYFGTVTEVMDDNEDKHGVTLLVQDAEPNFDRESSSMDRMMAETTAVPMDTMDRLLTGRATEGDQMLAHNALAALQHKVTPLALPEVTDEDVGVAGRAFDRTGNKPTVGTFRDGIRAALESYRARLMAKAVQS